MSENLMTGAVVAIGVSVVGKIIWDWLRGRNDSQIPYLVEAVKRMENNIISLNRIHEKTNGSGRPLVYFNEDSIEKIDELKSDLKTLPVVLNRILLELKSLHSTLAEAIRKVKE